MPRLYQSSTAVLEAANASGFSLSKKEETMTDHLSPVSIPVNGGERVDLGGLGIVWKIAGARADGRFSVVHHPLAPRALAAPLHRHTREDEYSYVLQGTLGALLGDDAITAPVGTWVCKPRNQWHTFWNAGDTPCEIVEIISPAGFENFFRELADIYAANSEPDLPRFAELCARFGLEMNPASVPELCERFGLTHPMA
jgi:mannose-6-phosphate isomerase-like protein (cupin superfamily)